MHKANLNGSRLKSRLMEFFWLGFSSGIAALLAADWMIRKVVR